MTTDPLASVERLLDHACANAMIGPWGQEKSREAVRLLLAVARDGGDRRRDAERALLAFARSLDE